MKFFTELRKELLGSKYWVVINIVGIVIYLYFASWVWAPLGRQNNLAGAGDNIIWTISAFRILILFAVIDSIWLVFVFVELFRRSAWSLFFIFLAISLLWYGAFRFDISRHYTGSPEIYGLKTKQLLESNSRII